MIRALAGQSHAHAYLITGPRGVGRRTFAVYVARALNCLAPPDQRPCGQCRPCRLIERGIHADVRIVRRAPERKQILIRPPSSSSATPAGRGYEDNVEFIQADAVLRPVDGRAKVYLILNAEELGADAAARLLKTIEEPPPYVCFLLTASDRGAVLPTIVSRCQEIPLNPVPRSELASGLVAVAGASQDVAEEIAALASGSPGWALSALQEPAVLDQYRAAIRTLVRALGANPVERLIIARSLSETWSTRPDAVRLALRAWIGWWRDLLLVSSGLADRVHHTDGASLQALQGLVAGLSFASLRAGLQATERGVTDLEANVNARLVLDHLLLRLPRSSTPVALG